MKPSFSMPAHYFSGRVLVRGDRVTWMFGSRVWSVLRRHKASGRRRMTNDAPRATIGGVR